MNEQARIFSQYHVGGVVLMTSPLDPDDSSIKLFKARASSGGITPLVATDEEGGMVQRFKALGVLPPPQNIVNEYSPDQAERLIADHGRKLKSVGIDMILGPLADVAPADDQSQLGSRVFSDNPEVVSQYAKAYVRGWRAAGLLPTLKHFPGMGSATGNTDYQVATTPPLSSLKQRDFIPYKGLALSGTAVMIGNQNVPSWFSGPASLSSRVNQYLRYELGYKNNLVVTDSLAAKAVTSSFTISQAVVKAIAAGNDIVLVVSPDLNNLTAAVNTKIISGAETALRKSVAEGSISKHQLAQAVVHKLSAQNISACNLLR
jgi:beta-N-acetylhexosaminidase